MKRKLDIHGHRIVVKMQGDLLDWLLDKKERKAVAKAFNAACSLLRLQLELAVRPMPDDPDQDYGTSVGLNDLRRRVDALEQENALLKDINAPDKERQATTGKWD